MNSYAYLTPFVRSLLITLIGSIVMTSGCGYGVCTMMGCFDQATVTIRHVDGRPVPLAVRVEIAGAIIDCPVPDVEQYVPCSDPQVEQLLHEVTTCEERQGNGVVSCHLRGTGQFVHRITIKGTPQQLKLTLFDGDRPVNERVFTPVYSAFQPNGRGCDPVCQSATDQWELP